VRPQGIDSIAGKRGGGCGDDGRRRELGDRNMIGMPVCTVRSERQNYVGMDSPYVSHNGRNSLAGVRTVELLIVVVEDCDLVHTQGRGGGAQLTLTDAPRANGPGC
jgi:hypothetical protein